MLKDLHELGVTLQNSYQTTFTPEDKELPNSFKQLVNNIEGSAVSYNRNSFVVTVNYSNQKIYFPNQLWYIAAYFADFYKSLSEYAQIIKTHLRISDDNIKKAKDNREIANSLIESSSIDAEDKEYLIRFLSDYDWWYGGKGIERADYYVSPILSLCKLVNASQSYVAELCKFLAKNEDALIVLKEINERREQNGIGANIVPTITIQKIFYGAPGTGKSHTIKEQTKAAEGDNRVFRTTFHPDSDYATFVGCYKPAMEPKEPIYKSAELINKLTLIKNSGVSYPCHKFAAKYWESLKELSANEIKAIVNACGFTDSMTVEVQKGQAIGEEIGSGSSQKQIVYRFIPQAFTNAYIRAWQTNEPVYLIIEEINRGNCAQIFGDLFQLLDRDERGFSKYPIIPDTDLGNYIHEQLASTHRDDAWAALIQGKEMELPDNLYIWASMNTSDQSLFPIDSAFKRRWDWEYVPIQDAGKDYKIKVNGSVYDWWEFVQAINKEVLALTHSEDKQLGYFFVRPANGIIDANMLVNKVYFYLWNDVFKDYEIDGQKAFKKPDAEEAIAFKDFFEGGLDEKLAEQVLQNLELGEEIQEADE